MAKDPAFLFYDGDAAKDVSHLNRLERGCYFDIIQAQRKFGRMPSDLIKKVLGKDFETCWEQVKICLSCVEDMYFIEWLENSSAKRKAYSESRSKNRTNSKSITSEKTYVEHMENEIVNENISLKEEGLEEGMLLCPKMVRLFKEAFKEYPINVQDDFKACGEIIGKIAKSKGWTRESTLNGNMENIMSEWKRIIFFVKTDNWFSGRSITDLNKEFQRLIQKMSNGGTTIKQNSSSGGINKPIPEIESDRGFSSL